MQTKVISQKGLDELIKREGFRNKAYRDSVGVWTIGVGHTSAAGPPFVTHDLVLTNQQVKDLLAKDIKQYERTVNECVHRNLEQHQFDALVSLCFNIGQGGFSKSTVVKRLNNGDINGAAEAILMWNKPPEIRGRRMTEYKQFKGSNVATTPSSKTATVEPTVVPTQTFWQWLRSLFFGGK